MIRVLLVDDHAVVREGLRAFLELQDGIEVVGGGGGWGGGRRRGRSRLEPDVILMDWSCRSSTASARCARSASWFPPPAGRAHELPRHERLLPAIQAGAAALSLKTPSPPSSRGRSALPTGARRSSSDRRGAAGERPADGSRTGREERDQDPPRARGLELIVRRRSNKRIALELGIAENGQDSRRSRARELGVTDHTAGGAARRPRGLVPES